jgi:tetraacyldisaccharide 4'-kinase
MRREIDLASPPANPVVFCGIAKPQQFFKQIRAKGITPAAEIIFRDHHSYDMDDVQAIRHAGLDGNAGGFVTTEKDLVNLGEQRLALEPLCIAQLQLILDRPAELLHFVLGKIRGTF